MSQITSHRTTRPWWTAVVSGMASYIDAAAIVSFGTHSNVVWSMRDNFVGVPTDCPQRDERLGWTGDLNAFAPTAAYLYDVRGMLGSWLQDLAEEQIERGSCPGSFLTPLRSHRPRPHCGVTSQ